MSTEYRIKYAFYADGQYSGEAGRVVDKEFYEKYAALGYAHNLEIVGLLPATSKSDQELDAEIAELLAEKERRMAEKPELKKAKKA